MKLIKKNTSRVIYTLELTDEELAHIWLLSYTKEGGDQFPFENRIIDLIKEVAPEIGVKGEFILGDRIQMSSWNEWIQEWNQ